MRITEGQLRRIIRDELNEDLQSFLDATRGIEYSAAGGDPNFTGQNKRLKSKARSIKQAWAAHSDQAGLQKVVDLVHWFSDSPKQAPRFMEMGRNNEISTIMHPKDEELVSGWGAVGIRVVGRITLASNNMNDLMTGYGEKTRAKDAAYYAASGSRKRPGQFYARHAGSYVLGPEDLDDNDKNEAVVANWTPREWVLQPVFIKTFGTKLYRRFEREALLDTLRSSGLPIVGSDGMKINIEELEALAG